MRCIFYSNKISLRLGTVAHACNLSTKTQSIPSSRPAARQKDTISVTIKQTASNFLEKCAREKPPLGSTKGGHHDWSWWQSSFRGLQGIQLEETEAWANTERDDMGGRAEDLYEGINFWWRDCMVLGDSSCYQQSIIIARSIYFNKLLLS